MTIAFALSAAAVSLVVLLVDPQPVLRFEDVLLAQRQDAENAVFLTSFFVILPLTLAAVPRLADTIASGPNAAALPSLAAALAGGLALALLLARVSDLLWGGGAALALIGCGIWAALAAGLLARAARPRPWPALSRVAGLSATLWALAGALVLGMLVGLTDTDSLHLAVLAGGGLAVGGALLAHERLRLPRLSGRWSVGADAAIAALLFAAVPDLVIFRPEEAPGNAVVAFETGIIQFHQNLLLGPANEVLAGGAVLVDTVSQYGVGPIYLLAAWLEVLPAGYGAFGLLDGLLTATLYASSYCLLRLAGVSRPLAAAGMAVAVLVLIYSLPYSVGALPEQGPLRFGLPMIVLTAAAVGARWPRHLRLAWGVAIVTVGLASIWAFEAFVYTLATFAGLVSVRACAGPQGRRLRWIGRQAALTAVACIAAHAIFAAATLAAAGELPDWGQYLAFLRGFLFGKLGEVTYDFSSWSPGLAVAAGYMASAAAIALLLTRRPDLARREWPAVVSLSGTTAYGIALFSYFVDRSGDGILPYVCLPALLTATLWIGLLLRIPVEVPRRIRLGALAFGLSVAALAVSIAWSSVSERFPRSALAHAAPRGKSLRDALDRLGDPPPLDSRAPAGELVLDRYLPGEHRVLIVTVPDLGVEILIRGGRANQLPFGDPIEDSFIASERLPLLREAVADLEPGTRLLLDRAALDALATIRSTGHSDRRGALTDLGDLAPLQLRVLEWIEERFRLRRVHSDGGWFTVAELALRR